MTDNRTTELLCKLLEEHGITWKKRRGYIRWSKQTKYGVTHYQAWPCFDGTITLTVRDEFGLTPEQAIAATLGNGTLTAEQVREAIEANSWAETSTIREFNDPSWQAIADELNAELGGGNCARCAEDMGRYADSLCDPLKERIAELLRCLENDWHIHASWDGLRKFWCIELTEEGVRVRDAELGSEFVECGICKFYHADIQLCEYGIPPCSKFERNELNARAERTCKFVSSKGSDYPPVCSACGYELSIYDCEWFDDGTYGYERNYCPNCGARRVDA